MKGTFTSISLLCCLFSPLTGFAQPADDAGSSLLVGTLTFEVEYDNVTTPLRYYSDGRRLRVELGELGEPYLIWIRGIEGIDGVAVLSPLVKNYSVEFDGPPIERLRSDGSVEKRRKTKEVELPQGKPAQLLGFNCTEYVLETDGPDTTVWMLNDAQTFPFLVTRSFENLFEAIPYLQKLSQQHNGIPVKIERKNWRGKIHFGMVLKAHDPEMPPATLYTIPKDYYKTASQIRGGRRGSGGGPGGGRRGGR